MKEYKPVDCDLYSRYELAILRRQRLRLAWYDHNGQCHLQAVQPLNLRSRARSEYMLARTASGHIVELRLDQIIRVSALSVLPAPGPF